MNKSQANICIFHTTDDDAYSGLVDDIAQMLAKPGHKVWSLGVASRVDDGLIAQLQAVDWLLVLLTTEQRGRLAHNRAIDKVLREKILSNAVMTVRLADPVHLSAPLPLASIQWADLSQFEKKYPSNRQDSKQLNDWQSWLSEQCHDILERIEQGSNAEPQLVEIAQRLKPTDFVSEMVSQADSFVARDWIMEQVNEWLQKSESRICLLEGPLGIGKSALSAYLAETHPSVIGAFFCHADAGIAHSPKDFVCTLAFQLAVRLPDYRAWLLAQFRENAKFSAESLQTMTTVQLAHELIFNQHAPPLTINPEDRETTFIIIDGIDRTLHGNLLAGEPVEPSLVELLVKEFDKNLPPYIRILITSRKVRDISATFTAKSITISQDDKRQFEDVAMYLRRSLEAAGFKEAKLEDLLTELKDAAKGSMLYAKTLSLAISNGDVSLPISRDVRFMELESHYLKTMEDIFDEATWRAPTTGVAPIDIARELAQHHQPLSKTHFLTTFNFLAPLYPILLHSKDENGEETVAFIHDSFAQWLIAPQQPHIFQLK